MTKQNVYISITRFLALVLWLMPLYACSGQVTQTGPRLTDQDIVVVHRPLTDRAQYADGDEQVYNPSEIGLGFVRPEDRNAQSSQLPQNDELRISNGQPLSLDLVLISGKDATFLMTALVDYQQTPFTLDGQPGLLHEIDIIAGKALYIPVQVNVDGPGAHDLIFAAFRDPYNRPMDQDFRDKDQCLFGSRRTVVIVGDDEQPIRSMKPDAEGNPPPVGVDWGVPFLFTNPGDSHPTSPEGQMSLTGQAKPGEAFVYKIWMSNLGSTNPAPVDYALVQFLNFRQVNFNGKDVYVVHLDANQEAIVENNLELPAKAGLNEIQIVYLHDPYKSLLRGEVLTPFVYSSPCLGIEVP